MWLHVWVSRVTSCVGFPLVAIDFTQKKIFSPQFVTRPQVNAWSESHATSWVSYLHHKSSPCESWWPYALQKSRYFIINLSRDLTWPLDKRFMRLYAWFLFIISHHPAKFGGHRSCRRKYIFFFLFHVLSCGSMVGESCDIMGKFSLWQVTILLGLVVTGVVKEKIFCF